MNEDLPPISPKANSSDGDYAGAQSQFKRWVHDSKGHELKGLVRRRAEEASMFGSKGPSTGKSGSSHEPTDSQPASPLKNAGPSNTVGSSNHAGASNYVEQFMKHADSTAKAEFQRGEKVVLALRTDTSTRANGGQGVYDDRMVVLHKRKDGSVAATEFKANTDPAGKYEARGYGADINGDGRKELGRLVEGTYHYSLQPGRFAGNRYFEVSKPQTALRDVNHDGRFTKADMLDRRNVGTTDYIHQGGNNTTGSASCQTLKPADYERFLAMMKPEKSFSYVLV